MLWIPSSFAVILFNMYLVIMTVNVTKKKTKLVTLASLATLCQAYFLANHAHLSRPGVFTSLGGDTVIAIIEWYVLAGLRCRDSVHCAMPAHPRDASCAPAKYSSRRGFPGVMPCTYWPLRP